MELHEIMSEFKVDSEKEKAFAKQICQSLHGSVRPHPKVIITHILVFILLGFLSNVYFRHTPGIVKMFVMILLMLAAVIIVWYHLSWEITFDGATGFMSYHTLFRGTVRFHVSEIQDIQYKTLHFRHGIKTDMMYLTVGDLKIGVALRQYRIHNIFSSNNAKDYTGGNTNVQKLCEYLDIYQRMFTGVKNTAIEGLSPRVAAAIARESKDADTPVQETKAAPVSLKKEPPADLSSSDVQPSEPVKQKKPEIKQKKSEVDVDALFNSVLQEYGKKR